MGELIILSKLTPVIIKYLFAGAIIAQGISVIKNGEPPVKTVRKVGVKIGE
jgi:hypothetical protein